MQLQSVVKEVNKTNMIPNGQWNANLEWWDM